MRLFLFTTFYTMKKLTLFTLLTIAACTNVIAQEGQKKFTPVRFLIRGGLELGGDEVAEIYFTNGNTQSVKAGQGGTIAIGGQFQFTGLEKLLLRATAGIKYVTTAADNAHIRLTRIPINLTANWMVARKVSIGAGLAMHRNIKFKADGIGPDLTFEGASGPTFEIAYSGIGLTYTSMNYKDNMNNKYSANAVGLFFTIALPNK